MAKLQIRQVEAFRAVVTLRSMTKAAEYLGVSQPAVSRLIADFQSTVGFKLFKRGRNSAEPTPDALLLFEQVDQLFLGLEELDHRINAISNMYTGSLTVAATNSYEAGFLTGLMARFKAAHKGIMMALHIQPHEQVIDWVASGRADVGFAIQPIAKSDITSLVLASAGAHCIFPKGHAFEEKDALKPSDLEGEDYVSFARGTPLRFLMDGLFDRAGVTRNLETEATSHHAVCSLVANKAGVALVNPFAPLGGHPSELLSRKMKPSITIDIQMLHNEAATSIVSEAFRAFVQSEAPALFASN